MNIVALVGRLTRDPETYTSQSGMNIVKFSVAVDRPFKDKQTGEYKADFPNCIAFDKSADFIYNYFKKGQRIGITGRLQTGSYEHKDGYRVYTTDVVVDRAEFVESKSQNSNSDSYSQPELAPGPKPEPEPAQTELPFPVDDEYPLPFDMGR